MNKLTETSLEKKRRPKKHRVLRVNSKELFCPTLDDCEWSYNLTIAFAIICDLYLWRPISEILRLKYINKDIMMVMTMAARSVVAEVVVTTK